MTLRNDDINPSTDGVQVREMYYDFWDRFPKANIISCVTIFGDKNNQGSVYGETPFKHKQRNWFYKVNSILNVRVFQASSNHEIASHGLLHLNHSNLSRDAQELSIVTSCEILKTKLFCAPFNAYNEDTMDICREYGISLLQEDNSWKSLEHNDFGSDQEFWYFHSWRYTPESFKELFVNTGERVEQNC